MLAVLVTGGTLAGAESPPADDRPHLLLVPHTPEGRAALERTDARVVARYGEFTLAEAAGGDDIRLRRAGADRRDDMREVSLPAAELDPKAERASLAAKEAPERDEALAIVQFIGPVKDAWLERLESTGARIVQYAAQNAYVVHARGAALTRIERLVGTDTAVRAVAPVRARDKVEAKLTRGGTRAVAVQTLAGAAGAEARRDAQAAGRRLRAESAVGELRTQFLELDGTETATLAADPAVVAIVPYGEPRLLDERAAQIVAGNLSAGVPDPPPPGYLAWHDAAGFSSTFDFTIDVTDEGLDNGSVPWHSDFHEDGDDLNPSRVTYTHNWTSDATARDCGGHGTNVASIAAGFGTAGPDREETPGGFKYGMGVAPRARIGASKVFRCDGAFQPGVDLAAVTAAAYADDAVISNNSWGFSDFGAYSVDSQLYDALVRDADPSTVGNQQMVEVFAAGNDGDEVDLGYDGYASVASPATAKNVIAVGASESVRPINDTDGCGVSDAEADDADDIINFSSRGPTDDLRTKPDLVAPGTHVAGAAPQHAAYDGSGVCNPQLPPTNPLYSLVSGSSQAAPEVAGAAALIRDWYSGGPGAGTPPSPALTKAILANTAADLQGGDNGKGDTIENAPNMDQGWGRVDMGAVLDSTIEREYHDQPTLLDSTGSSLVQTYDVADPGLPLKVTLAWTDAPGMVDADALVNDLDLVVEAGGRTYNGNVFAGGESTPDGSADRRNNLESVILPTSPSGRFAVKVVGTNIVGDGVPGDGDTTDQDFALVVSNANEQAPSPVLVHDQTTIDDSVGTGDGDGALELGERIEIDEQVRNAGNAAATGIDGSLAGVGDLTIDAPGPFQYPDAPMDAQSTNATPFAGQLALGAVCGARAEATLTLDTDQGIQTVPLTLPTGVPSSRADVASTDVPKAIPDDSAGGVESTLAVAPAGVIKDLNVRITGINHPWVGDLRIEVIGPDGTVVKLAEHPGGPDNSGNNLTSTVFDDEAPTNISAGTAPYTGSFRPQNDQLSRFDGKEQQGTWTLRVRDLFEGDTGTLAAWRTETRTALCIDGARPETTIDTGPSGTVASSTASFTFSSNEAGGSFECSLDGSDFSTCLSPHGLPGLAEGSHTFEVRARNALDDADLSPASRTWTVDLPPDTAIASGPSGPTASRDASFTFASTESGSSFECSLDGGPLSPCNSPHTLLDLSEGGHTLAVEARDSSGNLDPTPATRTWTVDVTAPGVTLNSPTGGTTTTDGTPSIGGSAGVAADDAGSVTVQLFPGTLASGLATQTLISPRDANGLWSVEAAALAPGVYTARALQSDAAGNVGASAAVTFTIVASPTTDAAGPRFAIAPAEEHLADARAGRLTVMAGCVASCRVAATLTLSGRIARRVGLGTGSIQIGSASASPPRGGGTRVRIPLNRRARAALRLVRSVSATLNLTVADDGGRVVLRRLVVLSRAAGIARMASRGLRLWAACDTACGLRGQVTIGERTANRMGLRTSGRSAVAVGTGSSRAAAGTTSRLVLRLSRRSRRALLSSRGVSATLEATVTGASGPAQRAARRLTLRR